MKSQKHTAIVAAAGNGSRMHTDIPKQYLELAGKPVLYYSLSALEQSFIDEIILVTGPGDEDYCRREIIDRFCLKKVTKIIPGGTERYLSVYQGILAAEDAEYLYIQDGARPLLTGRILEDAKDCVIRCKACAAGMPVKDTIKIADENGFAVHTPDRAFVWQIQTPQVFSAQLIRSAYEILIQRLEQGEKLHITDDAMVVETMLQHPVKLFAASYENIKITTPEDLRIAEEYLTASGQR